MFRKLIIITAFCVMLGNVYASTTKPEHYIFRYESGDIYEIQLNDNTITWKGLQGADRDLSETDSIKRKKLSQDVDVIQWTEKNGLFVTLALDRTHLTVVSSGKNLDENWLMYGVAEMKN